MPKKTSPKPLIIDDPDEAIWRDAYALAETHNRSELERFGKERVAAMRDSLRSGKRPARVTPLRLVEAPALPDWQARRPVHVMRELLGRFALDRDAMVIHDCYAAVEACALDDLSNLTFVHFAGELAQAASGAQPCPACMEAAR